MFDRFSETSYLCLVLYPSSSNSIPWWCIAHDALETSPFQWSRESDQPGSIPFLATTNTQHFSNLNCFVLFHRD